MLLRQVVVLLALAMSAAVAGCAGGARPAPPATTAGGGPLPTPPAASAARAPTTLVMVIRHGEKPDGADPGVDAQGKPDDSSLTATGWERAKRLVDLFDPVPGPPRPGACHAEGDLRCRRERRRGGPAAAGDRHAAGGPARSHDEHRLRRG